MDASSKLSFPMALLLKLSWTSLTAMPVEMKNATELSSRDLTFQ
jgi:hypothetical protein